MTDRIRDRDWDSFPRRVQEVPHTWIPMADGTRLAARVWLPEDVLDQPVPGILEFLPYRKNDGTHLRDSRNAPYFAGHGYAVIRVDVRGTGDSEGVLRDEYTEIELADGVETIAWIAGQRWCTGKVGIMGISWGGFNGLQIAALQPPELAAVVSLCSTDDRYADDVHYFGGQLLADQQLSWATTMLAFDARPPDPVVWGPEWVEVWRKRLESTPPFIEPWMHHQRRDAFWQHGSVCENPAAIRAPVLLAGGWQDAYRDAILRMLTSLEVPRRGIIGPWAHLWPHFAVPGPRVGFLQEALRWWDRWLKDEPNGIEDEPMLLSWVQDPAPPRAYYAQRPGRWVADPAWPSPHVTMLDARLTASRGIELGGGEPRVATEDATSMTIGSAQAHGVAGGRSAAYGTAYDLPIDQRVDDGWALCFDSDPLSEPLDILGIAEADLELSADRPQALVAVRLVDVARDGAGTLVTRGVLNLSHRHSHEHPQALEPGERVRARFPLHAVGYRVPAGHRLRIALAPTLWPTVWPAPEPVCLSVYAERSQLRVPLRTAGGDTTFPFPDPEQARFDHLPIEADERGTVTRDLATGVTTVVYEESGGYRLPLEGGEELRNATWERDTFEIDDEDPTSARAISERRIDLSRGDWVTAVEARGEMTCEQEMFRVDTSVTAWAGTEQVFTREWSFSIPRDHT